ncbi:MAG: hypothetical protein COV74_09715 [Candidatus Omnitrophica bacterium CG11_big_fil_rev_8_21_14_0_20_45_26]|uniref:Oxidoreductase n=1 Tax=Candidatus Abzuiibacterium crystallinum TaxID=1974748 RepID=A0A2H0LLJ2_9BACT|nr:MAG: hypothetical protein COV74_09715 [Candidatus Omnitrophica bacterium CG11_big_fil_rev_8_21_14_0_20_45_26]PIW64485.1 MAG: hypothetical protein COW12_05840 [Candidatus Omnitrophica bacterium CG12_big_fil_rev_8_21_14_0_65_45_16]
MKFGIIGLGSIGKRHGRNLIALGVQPSDIIGVDLREDRRQEAKEKLNLTKTVSSIDELCADKIDCAFICSPTSLHTAHAKQLIQHGVALFIEKPAAHQLDEELSELAKQIEAKQIKTLVGYVFRFSDHVRHLKALLDQRVIGRILSVRGEFSEYLPDWHPWEDYRSFYMAKKSMGGGSLLDQSHILDLCHYLFGEIDEVFAFNGKASQLEVEADDFAEMSVRFKSGLIGSVHQDMFGREHKKFLDIKGEKGNLFWNVYQLSVTHYDGETKKSKTYTFGTDHNQMYLNQTRHLLDILENKQQSLIPLEVGLHTMAVIQAVERSQAEKRLVKVGEQVAVKS